MENELRPDSNLLQRVIATIREDSKAVTIAQVAMIISIAFAILTLIAISASLNANLRAEYQDDKIQKMEDDLAVYRVRYANWVALMKTKGVELPEEEK